jgi:hypothetical protein
MLPREKSNINLEGESLGPGRAMKLNDNKIQSVKSVFPASSMCYFFGTQMTLEGTVKYRKMSMKMS